LAPRLKLAVSSTERSNLERELADAMEKGGGTAVWGNQAASAAGNKAFVGHGRRLEITKRARRSVRDDGTLLFVGDR
jgi:hypothetical protein